MPVRDATPAWVIRANFNGHAIARQNTDVVLPHAPADRGKDHESVVALDAKHRVGKCFLNNAVKFKLVALAFFSLSPIAHSYPPERRETPLCHIGYIAYAVDPTQ